MTRRMPSLRRSDSIFAREIDMLAAASVVIYQLECALAKRAYFLYTLHKNHTPKHLKFPHPVYLLARADVI